MKTKFVVEKELFDFAKTFVENKGELQGARCIDSNNIRIWWRTEEGWLVSALTSYSNYLEYKKKNESPL